MFGPGFGEAICVHIGNGNWVIVDSCLNPETGEPAALEYLGSLGVDLARQAVLVVVTHWDDDHIRGMGQTAEVCTSAVIACSAALQRKEVLQFVIENENAGGALGSGLDELRTILRLPNAAKRIIWAKANLPLHPRPPGDTPTVVALSPSEEAFERSIRALIAEATGRPSALQRRYRAPEGPNGASIATSVRAGNDSLLLALT